MEQVNRHPGGQSPARTSHKHLPAHASPSKRLQTLVSGVPLTPTPPLRLTAAPTCKEQTMTFPFTPKSQQPRKPNPPFLETNMQRNKPFATLMAYLMAFFMATALTACGGGGSTGTTTSTFSATVTRNGISYSCPSTEAFNMCVDGSCSQCQGGGGSSADPGGGSSSGSGVDYTSGSGSSYSQSCTEENGTVSVPSPGSCTWQGKALVCSGSGLTMNSTFSSGSGTIRINGYTLTCGTSSAAGTSASTTVSTRFSLVPKTGGFYDKTECVKDNSTGLIWEGKTASPATSRLGTSTYTNYDGDGLGQKSGGANATQAEIDASTNSIGYKNSVNTSALCGYTDWRLPTHAELRGILASSGSPMIDTTWFPNTQAWFYWTSSPFVGICYDACYVSFSNGYVNYYGNRYPNYHVRLVR